MVQRQMALFCTATMLWVFLCPNAPAFQGEPRRITLEERVTMIPSGSTVVVNLQKTGKMVGRLGAVTDSGFEFQRDGAASNQPEVLPFQNVKSVSFKKAGPKARVSKVPHGATLKERLAAIRPGSVVEMKLRNQPAVRGRLGTLTDAGVEMQYVRNDRLLRGTFAFDDLQSVRVINAHKPWGGTIGIVLLAVGVGALAAAAIFGRTIKS